MNISDCENWPDCVNADEYEKYNDSEKFAVFVNTIDLVKLLESVNILVGKKRSDLVKTPETEKSSV